ncbi:MAG: tetratricopeptide repeat protein [bacterium]|nr:tetratricopeptide repeat protein [bacterium]
MLDALLLLLVFVFGALAFYLMYERFYKKTQHIEPSMYVEALRNLLDGKQESAFTKLRQVVAEDAGNIDAYLRLGQLLREHNRPDRALQVHKDLTLRYGLTKSDKISILRELASDYLALNDHTTADAALKELATLEPENHWAFVTRLKLQEKAGQWEEAYDTAVQLLKLEGNKSKTPLARFKFQQGEQLYKTREYHKARIAYKEAISIDPSFVPAYIAVGDSYREEERFEDAVNFWTKLIEAVPEQAHLVIDRLKNVLFTLGRFGEIVEICRQILEHSPKNLEARRAMAEFYVKKGDLEAAEEMLEAILDEQPEDPFAIVELVRIYLELGDNKRLHELRRALEFKRDRKRSPAKPGNPAVIRS